MGTRTRRVLGLAALTVLWLAPRQAQAQPDEVATAYLELLQGFAEGREQEALRRLMGLEWRFRQAGQELEQMRRLQLAAAEALTQSDSWSILPLLALHEQAYLAYRTEGAMDHALHARSTMLELCDLLAARALTGAQRRLAADWYASLGGYSQETSTGPIVMSLFQRALAVDGTNEAALLGAAMDLEERGRFGKALPLLGRLYGAHPENAEGRLRYAVNLDRVGRSSTAMTLLQDLLDTAAPAWVLSLAHQTLARMLMDTGQWDRARTVLERGVERHPEDQTLAVVATSRSCVTEKDAL